MGKNGGVGGGGAQLLERMGLTGTGGSESSELPIA